MSAEPDWQEIDPAKHAWIVELGEEGPLGMDRPQRLQRFYVPKGKRLWPLLSVAVATRWRAKGQPKRHRIVVEASVKTGRESWWDERYGVPPALVPAVGLMFADLIESLS